MTTETKKVLQVQPSKTQLAPTGDWIVVDPLDDPDMMVGNIALFGSGAGPEKYGQVVAVGPGFVQNGQAVPPRVKVGDVVMYKSDRGVPMRLNSEEILFMTERDLFAVVAK